MKNHPLNVLARPCLGLCVVLLILLIHQPVLHAQADEERAPRATLGQEVNEAIKKGVKFLRQQQMENGGFHAIDPNYPEGSAALCMLAMLKSSVYREDPAILKTLAFLRYKPHNRTYSTGVRILAFDAANNKDLDSSIQAAAKWLVDTIHKRESLWAYPDHICDLSNTQYAVLGLWAAERHGFTAPESLWIDLAGAVMKVQNENGGFRYSPLRGESSGSMTTAGIFVLEVCLAHIPEGVKHAALRDRVQISLKRAWEYMDRRFSITGNPIGDHTYVKKWLFYYLYGLERACAISGREKVGDRDWYREGAIELIRSQGEDGRWNDSIDTAFALLFLRLSTYTSMKKKHESNLDGSGAGVRKVLKPQPQIPFVRNWLILGPFDHKNEAGFTEDLIGEEKIDPKEGKRTERIKWVKYRSHSEAMNLAQAYSIGVNAPSRESQVLGYAFTRLEVVADTPAILWFGSDDAAQVRLDGKLVFEYPFRCEDSADTHRVSVNLSKGIHRLLVKVMNFDGPWQFFIRFSALDGSPIQGLVPFTDKDGPTDLERFDAATSSPTPDDILEILPLDRKPILDFTSEGDLDRFIMVHNSHPAPLKAYKPAKGKNRTGRQSIVAVQAMTAEHPARIYRRVKVGSKRTQLVARLSSDKQPAEVPADWPARLGVYDGSLTWLAEEVISAKDAPYPRRWKEITADLSLYSGEDVLVILECARAGENALGQGYVDEFSIRVN